MSFLGEIRRRKAFQVAAVYGVVAWLLIQVAATVEEPLFLPWWFDTAIIVVLLVGFPVTMLVSWGYNLTREGLVAEAADVPARGGRRIEIVLICLLAVALGWIGYRELGGTNENSASILPNSIVVLPLDNLGSEENSFYAEGMHGALISRLSKLSTMNVISRQAVLQVPRDQPLLDTARALGVESLLAGTFQFANGRIRVDLELFDPATNTNLWTADYEEDFSDVFAVQADIAMNVANALEIKFSTEEQEALLRAATSSPDAYRLLLQAQSLEAMNSTESIRQAGLLIERALELDPEFAAAHGERAVLLASSFVDAVGGGFEQISLSPEEWEREVRERAELALELDPTIGSARVALALINMFTWHWTDALAEFRLAAQATPWDAGNLQFYAWFTAYTGNVQEGVEFAERTLELNPNLPNAYQLSGMMHAYADDYAAAETQLIKAQELLLNSPLLTIWRAFVAMGQGDDSAALDELRRTESLIGDNVVVVLWQELAWAYSRLGRIDDAERLFRDVERVGGDRELGDGTWAMLNLAVGDLDEALRRLESAAEKTRNHGRDLGFWSLMNLKMNVINDSRLIDDPRFVEVLSRIEGD